MKIAEIQKLDATLTWQTTHTFNSFKKAMIRMVKMANRYGWRFVNDQSLFGGYYVDDVDGSCYRVH